MNGTKLFLVISVLIWTPYGIFLIFQPSFLADAAGLVGTTATGTTELRAMYGGLQAAIGALCLLSLLRPGFTQTALVTLCFMTGGLASARALGLMMDGGLSGYTAGALVFEIINTAVAYRLLRKELANAPLPQGAAGVV